MGRRLAVSSTMLATMVERLNIAMLGTPMTLALAFPLGVLAARNISIVLLRWDINVRESAVLGLVGAGGIELVLGAAINAFLRIFILRGERINS